MVDAAKLTAKQFEAEIALVCEAFAQGLEPAIRKASEDIYDDLLATVQHYLTTNAQWNLSQIITRNDSLAAENIALRKHADALAEALGLIVAHYSDDVVNAPGHGHCRPGIWDDDNGPELAGKPCEWCADWAKAREAIAAARSAGK